MSEMAKWIKQLEESVVSSFFVKITVSKPRSKNADLQNIYIRKVVVGGTDKLSFTYRYTTNDQVKNFSIEDAVLQLEELIPSQFLIATLFTTEGDYILQANKKGVLSIREVKASILEVPGDSHNRMKEKRAKSEDDFLFHLGVTTKGGDVIPKMADKYRQINKYLEIIDAQLQNTTLPDQINIVDMGSGKGYLTFALYDFLKNKKGLAVTVIGIELREGLVDYCNDVARKCGFEHLRFECKPIQDFVDTRIDVLIALHACDTATDDAIYKGIVSQASLIVCAPCCHKQIRKQVKGQAQESPLLKYGIFKERQFEMVTDTIRALILEKEQYQTKIFEFVSNEHTRKNIMLIGSKSKKKVDAEIVDSKIEELKAAFHIQEHYLETLLD